MAENGSKTLEPGTVRKMRATRKWLSFNHLLYMSIFAYRPLLPDAELLEDIAQHLVGGDGAGDGAKVVEGLAEVLGD